MPANKTEEIKLILDRARKRRVLDLRGDQGKWPIEVLGNFIIKGGIMASPEAIDHGGLSGLGDADHAAYQQLSGNHGTYTPTLTNVANLDASTAYKCQWLRFGNTVIVSGKVDVDPTVVTTLTQLGISLPVASTLTAQEDCAGTANASGVVSESAAIRGDAANNRAEMAWITTQVANQPMYFIFAYEVK